MPPEFDSTFEERIAIMFYDGGLSEQEARERAYRICYLRTEITRHRDGRVDIKHTLVAPTEPKPKPPPPQEEQLELLTPEEAKTRLRQLWRDY